MTLHPRRAARATLLIALASAALLSACVVAPARGRYYGGVDVEVAPPAERVIVAPAPRGGYVYAPGYWRWNGREHVWVEGRYLRERRGYHWVPDHWTDRNGRYHFEQGHWVR